MGLGGRAGLRLAGLNASWGPNTYRKCQNSAILVGMDTYPLCPGCGSQVSEERQRRRAKCCSNRCTRDRANRNAYTLRSRPVPLPTGTVGAMHELIVAIDLARKGYHVFRALSPACPCDLVVVAPGAVYRVEVTTGYRGRNGRVASPAQKMQNQHKFDVLAIIVGDSEILYRGVDLPIVTATAATAA